ncbi:hypothetical protein QBC39DRAFT_350315 [Podospora conica]|nr:hypothetical protein QBC39DRAFT_350315 [Schizothecium conicum]
MSDGIIGFLPQFDDGGAVTGWTNISCEFSDYWQPDVEPGLAGCCIPQETCAIHRECTYRRSSNPYWGDCGNRSCREILIFDQYPREEAKTTWTQWRCGDQETTTSVYRQIGQSTTASESTLSAKTTLSESTFLTVPIVTTNTGPALPSGTSGHDGTPVQQTAAPTTSRAWIAGAVAGPIVIVVLVAAVLLFRRRLSAKTADHGPDNVSGQGGLGLGSNGEKIGGTAGLGTQFTPLEKMEPEKAMTEAVELPCPDYVPVPQSHASELGASAPVGREIRISCVS